MSSPSSGESRGAHGKGAAGGVMLGRRERGSALGFHKMKSFRACSSSSGVSCCLVCDESGVLVCVSFSLLHGSHHEEFSSLKKVGRRHPFCTQGEGEDKKETRHILYRKTTPIGPPLASLGKAILRNSS